MMDYHTLEQETLAFKQKSNSNLLRLKNLHNLLKDRDIIDKYEEEKLREFHANYLALNRKLEEVANDYKLLNHEINKSIKLLLFRKDSLESVL